MILIGFQHRISSIPVLYYVHETRSSLALPVVVIVVALVGGVKLLVSAAVLVGVVAVHVPSFYELLVLVIVRNEPPAEEG
jgi:hypothetical protein